MRQRSSRRRPRSARRPADKARKGGIPGVFRPKGNDERPVAPVAVKMQPRRNANHRDGAAGEGAPTGRTGPTSGRHRGAKAWNADLRSAQRPAGPRRRRSPPLGGPRLGGLSRDTTHCAVGRHQLLRTDDVHVGGNSGFLERANFGSGVDSAGGAAGCGDRRSAFPAPAALRFRQPYAISPACGGCADRRSAFQAVPALLLDRVVRGFAPQRPQSASRRPRSPSRGAAEVR